MASYNTVPLPPNIHSYPYYVVVGMSDDNCKCFYSTRPLVLSPGGDKIDCPPDTYYTHYHFYGTEWTDFFDVYRENYQMLWGYFTPVIFEGNYAIGPYTPPPHWRVKLARVKGAESDFDWPVNTHNYSYRVLYECWSYYLGIFERAWEEVIYSETPCTYNEGTGFPNNNIANTGSFERYRRPKGFTGAWTYRYDLYNTYVSGIYSIYGGNYSIGSYVAQSTWQLRIARIKVGNANQKWADYPESPNIVVTGIDINTEEYPYQVVFEMQGNGTTVPTGKYLWVSKAPLVARLVSGQKSMYSSGGTPRAFLLIDGVWVHQGTRDGWTILDMYESNHNIIDDDTSGVYFAKSTSPSMDYSPIRWAIRPVKVRVQ